jgi:hypothetical protein
MVSANQSRVVTYKNQKYRITEQEWKILRLQKVYLQTNKGRWEECKKLNTYDALKFNIHYRSYHLTYLEMIRLILFGIIE